MDVCLQLCAFCLSLFLFPVAFGCIDENCRILVFPPPFFFINKRLVNHTIGTRADVDFETCKLHCYHENNCTSVNYREKNKTCELNNATHLLHDNEFEDKVGYLYHGADSACDKSPCYNGGICQSGFSARGYRCLCPSGFKDFRCQADVDECRSSTDNDCSTNATCNNTKGSYNCSCKPGYSGNGRNCSDIDECRSSSHNNCSSNAICNNTPGSFNCSCKPGYSGNGYNCSDIDECNAANNSCHENAWCNNTQGSFNCSCKPGYEGDGHNCTDIDECQFNSHNCSNNAICNNTKGSFNCSCKPGYSGNGHNCSDIDECDAANNSCHENAWCNNTQGSFTCSCKPGYEGDGYNCTDADECLNNSHNCSENATCTNTEGSFNCSCKPGYIGNGHNCSEFSINSKILHGNQYYLQHLHRFLASAPEVGEDSSWLLCYRATLHGWGNTIFHQKCDNKRNTVTIIKKGSYVFGGYTDIPWESSGGYAETPNAFIFSLNNFEMLAPFVSKVMTEKKRRAIYRLSYYGPKFSDDLVIYLDAAKRKDSKARLGSRYSVPPGVHDKLTVLAGTQYFSPDEVEVFYLGTSR
ncbi:hypothetical protein ABFA07_021226 [Porites harrisoni]